MKIYAGACIFSIYYFTQLSDGGLQFGHLATIALCLLLSLPIILWEVVGSSVILRVGSSLLLISLVLLNLFSKIVSNHVLQSTYYLGLVFMFFLSKFLARRFKYSLQLIILAVGSLNTYFGIVNWKTAIAPGEDRLWRSVPWHNPSAAMASLLMFASLGLLLASFKKSKSSYILIPIYLVFTLIFTLELLLTGSRGAIILSLLGLVSLLIYNFKDSKKVLVVFLLLLAALLPASNFANNHAGKHAINGEIYMGSANSSSDKASSGLLARSAPAAGNLTERFRYWVTATKMFANNPLMGQGLGSWESVVWKFRASNEDLSTATHNDFLQALAEGGLLLFLPFVFLVCYLLLLGLRYLRVKAPTTKSKLLNSSLYIGIFVFILHSNIDFNSRYFQTWFTFALLIGWLVGRGQNHFQVISLSNESINECLEKSESSLNGAELEVSSSSELLNDPTAQRWYKIEKNRKSPIIIPLMMALLFATPALLVINDISTNGKSLDNYRNYSARGIKVPMFDPSTAFDSAIALHNAFELSNKKLYNLAILELQQSEKYNPGDSRLKLYELLIKGVSEKKASDFTPYLFTKDGHYWTTGYLDVLWMYSMLDDKENFFLYLRKLENLNAKHLGWEYYTNQSWFFINSLLYENRFGDGCQSQKAMDIESKAEDFFLKSPKSLVNTSVGTYNSICETKFELP